MNLYDFMSAHYITAFAMLVVIASSIVVIYQLTVQLINRILRHWNIRKHGYPPQHCDADGDFHPDLDLDQV